MRINFATGQGIDSNTSDYKSNLPVNLVPTPYNAPDGANYYLRSWFGVSLNGDTSGSSRGAQYNEPVDGVYRVNGNFLQLEKGGEVTTQTAIDGLGQARLAYSRKTQVVVSDGKAYYWDGQERTLLQNWSQDEAADVPQGTNYDLSNIIDVARVGKRYIYASKGKDGFIVTDILNEQRPDRNAAFTSSEAMPDDIVGVSSFRNMAVAFGSSSTEFFQKTGDTQFIFKRNEGMFINAGICSTSAYCSYNEAFACVGKVGGKQENVWVSSGGRAKEIGNKTIIKAISRLRQSSGLDSVKIEHIKYMAYDTLILHLGEDTYGYESSTGAWFILSSDGVYNRAYQAVDHVYSNETGKWSAGNKSLALCGELEDNITTQFGTEVESLAFTECLSVQSPTILTRMKLEAITGYQSGLSRLLICTSIDGVNFSSGSWIEYDKKYDFNSMFIVDNFGSIDNKLYLKIKFIPVKPLSISGLRFNE